ncbi:mechanosensitive ion channel family protein [Gulosibacter macacae]|uniref:Mechanosensitive ion channel family protein n=1 Tax=Gulosibacter macacae TaxID=2488791 RepID=A0A3P3VYL3_9MICO|nr:mechanosensitive ion channel domain-containing protein [Gulosibacter macacae]RRJ87790.1 mechanosensitive ion channel family protein [Gulosibacter macacae]
MQEFVDSIIQTLGPFWPLVQVVFIILGAWVANRILKIMIRRSVGRIVDGVKRKRGVDDTQALVLRSPLESVRTVQRTRTIGQVLSNLVGVTVFIIAVLWSVAVINPSFLASLTVLSAALGAGLGFGAQKIVGDVLNGMFMVMEDQIGVGDDVDMQHAKGVVEAVGVRVTQVRDVYGQLWYVRNGEIQRVGNNSQGWNRAIIDLAVPFDEDRDRAEAVMLAAAISVYEDVDWMGKVIEKPTIWGLETLSAEAVIVRLVAKTLPGERWAVQREMRARIQDALKQEGLELPALNTIIFNGVNGDTVQPSTGYSDRREQQDRADRGEA